MTNDGNRLSFEIMNGTTPSMETTINFEAPNRITPKADQRRTELLRVYLREEFPEIEDSELIMWKYEGGEVLFCFNPLKHSDPATPGQKSVNRLRLAIEEEKNGKGRLSSVLPIRWRSASAGEMKKLERELNEANRSITEAKTHLQEADLPDEPIDIQAKRLRDAHDWQAGIAAGYERQIQAANETLRKLNDALDEANADKLRLLSFIKELNATKFAHGREYRSKCGKFLQAFYAPPPPVVAKPDADALADAIEYTLKADTILRPETDHVGMRQALESYRTKYQ